MDQGTRERLQRVWNQREIPVLLRREGNRPRMRVPAQFSNEAWLRAQRRSKPKWDHKKHYWEVPATWFKLLVPQCLETFGQVYIIQPYREQEKCAPACWNAKGDECECSCMGEHHGKDNPTGRWKVISDTFATRFEERAVACRLVRLAE